jgi:hypothetical protein
MLQQFLGMLLYSVFCTKKISNERAFQHVHGYPTALYCNCQQDDQPGMGIQSKKLGKFLHNSPTSRVFLCILGWLPKANIISNYF